MDTISARMGAVKTAGRGAWPTCGERGRAAVRTGARTNDGRAWCSSRSPGAAGRPGRPRSRPALDRISRGTSGAEARRQAMRRKACGEGPPAGPRGGPTAHLLALQVLHGDDRPRRRHDVSICRTPLPACGKGPVRGARRRRRARRGGFKHRAGNQRSHASAPPSRSLAKERSYSPTRGPWDLGYLQAEWASPRHPR